MKRPPVTFNIGKNGFSQNVVETLKNAFKSRENVKVVLLKSAGHEKDKVKEIADQIANGLGSNYTYKIVGFTIFLKKWRKAKR